MILVAVVDASTDEPGAVRVGDLAALVADEPPPGNPSTDPTALLRHAALVDDVFARHRAVLPARAGTTVDADALAAWLEGRQADLRTSLDLLRDRCELAVTWTGAETPGPTPDAPPGSSPGAAYLERLRASWAGADHAERALDVVRRDPVVVDVRVLSRSPGLVKASLLVDRDSWVAVRDEVAAGLTPDGQWRCTGPYPAYSFVRTGAPA